MQKLNNLWHSRSGYAMITVLCALMLFTVLGSNVLLAAQAAAGTTARKQDDTQAYVLAVSALNVVSSMIEQGDFSTHLQNNVLVAGGPTTDAQGNTTYGAWVTTQIALPNFPAGAEQPKVSVDFSAEEAAGLLTARITVTFRSATYSFLADFRHQPNVTEPAKSKWVLKGYRNNRVYTVGTTP